MRKNALVRREKNSALNEGRRKKKLERHDEHCVSCLDVTFAFRNQILFFFSQKEGGEGREKTMIRRNERKKKKKKIESSSSHFLTVKFLFQDDSGLFPPDIARQEVNFFRQQNSTPNSISPTSGGKQVLSLLTAQTGSFVDFFHPKQSFFFVLVSWRVTCIPAQQLVSGGNETVRFYLNYS